MQLSVEGAEIAYDDTAGGSRALLLVHGHPFDRSMWLPQIVAASAAGWRVITPDLRGYGGSTGCAEKTTLDVFAGDLASLLDQLGIAKLVIGGLSMGGQIVMEFCRSFPDRVSGLILAATFPRSETEEGKTERLRMADQLISEGMAAYAHGVLDKMLSPDSIKASPELAANVLHMMLRAPPAGAAAALRGRAERPCYKDTLRRVEAPALIVVGDQDAFTTEEDALEMQQLVRNSRLLRMKGVGHMPNLERPKEFNEALIGFLAGLPAEAGAAA